MAVNDLITVGATPLVVQAYWAAGGSEWFADAERAQALVDGWKRACDICGVAWGGGETPALAGIVEAGRIDLAAVVHRHRQPEGRGSRSATSSRPATRSCCSPRAASTPTASAWRASWPSGCRRATSRRWPRARCRRRIGEALLAPTVLYSPITEALYQGRHPRRTTAPTSPATAGASCCATAAHFTYRIHTLPDGAAGAAFIQQQAGLDDRDAYGTFNMGAGFALFVAAEDAERSGRGGAQGRRRRLDRRQRRGRARSSC